MWTRPDHSPTSTSRRLRSSGDGQPEPSGDDLRRLAGAQQVARADRVDPPPDQRLGELARLLAAACVERTVGVTLPAPLAVPVGLAVACEEERRHAANVAARWISDSATRCASSPARRPGIGELGRATAARGRARRSSARAVATRDPGISHVAGDLSRPDEPARLVAAAEARFGRIDCLVNNVGGTSIRKLDELTDADWQASFELNLMSAVRTTRAVLPGMRARGSGAIVNVSSTAAKRPSAGMPDYSVMKAAMLSFSRLVADLYAGDGIRCNAVTPGPTATDAWIGDGGLADQQGERARRAREGRRRTSPRVGSPSPARSRR